MKHAKKKKNGGIFLLPLILLILIPAALTLSWSRGKDMSEATPPPPSAETAPPTEYVESEAAEPPHKVEVTGHIHAWEPVYGTVHQDAVTEDYWVTDTEAWLEPREAAKERCACVCGITGTYEQITRHIKPYREAWEKDPSLENEREMQKHGYDTSDMDDWIVHEAEGHWEQRVIKEAYDGEGVVGYICPGCGAER